MNHQYTTREAAQQALAWCEKHPSWMRLCDIDNIDRFYVQWHELTAKAQHLWGSEDAYNEFGTKKPKVKIGFVTDTGRFVEDNCRVQYGHAAMVLRVGIEVARDMREQRQAEQENELLVAAL